MTSLSLGSFMRVACLASAFLTTGVMTYEAYAHSVRWPQNTCRTSLSGHCKKAKPIAVALVR